MKKPGIVLMTILGLLSLCILLIIYTAYVHFTQDEPDSCFSSALSLSLSDFQWNAGNVSLDGYLDPDLVYMHFHQNHWGEYEFAILQAAIDSFVPLPEGIMPPWYYYDQGHRWWRPMTEESVNRVFTILRPFEKGFFLTTEIAFTHTRYWYSAEGFQFFYSQDYGAFAITSRSTIPRENICGMWHFYTMDSEAFIALLSTIVISMDNEAPSPIDDNRRISERAVIINHPCITPLSVADFEWRLGIATQDGYALRNVNNYQDHWGEYEFAILEAAISSFIVIESGFRPPWVHHEYASWLPQNLWENSSGRLRFSLDAMFGITAYGETPHGEHITIERITFLHSEEYGSFAVTYHGNIPRWNFCGAIQFFHMDAAAFWALFNVLDVGEVDL